MPRQTEPVLEKEVLKLEDSDAESFLEYMQRERTTEDRESYTEADEFYKNRCKF